MSGFAYFGKSSFFRSRLSNELLAATHKFFSPSLRPTGQYQLPQTVHGQFSCNMSASAIFEQEHSSRDLSEGGVALLREDRALNNGISNLSIPSQTSASMPSRASRSTRRRQKRRGGPDHGTTNQTANDDGYGHAYGCGSTLPPTFFQPAMPFMPTAYGQPMSSYGYGYPQDSSGHGYPQLPGGSGFPQFPPPRGLPNDPYLDEHSLPTPLAPQPPGPLPETPGTKKSRRPETKGPKRPVPTKEYLEQAKSSSPRENQIETPKALLLVLDLNGTLIARNRRNRSFEVRSMAVELIERVQKHHKLMIWTSATPESLAHIMRSERLFTSREAVDACVATWGRDKLGLSKKQYEGKTQVYKRLQTVWSNPTIQESHPDAAKGGHWDATNTVLVDDSVEKAAAQPYNLICVPEFVWRAQDQAQDSSVALQAVLDTIDKLSLVKDVSQALYQQQCNEAGRML